MSSIETRRSSITGALSYRVKFRHRGKQHAPTFLTEQDAKAWQVVLDKMGPDMALRLLEEPDAPAPTTVADLIDHHIDHLTGIDEGTVTRYRNINDAHLRPYFEQIPADALTRDDVARWVNAQTCAPKTLRNWQSLLSDSLSSAVKGGVIATNVARGVKLPRADAAAGDEMVYLTRPEFMVLLSHVPPRWQPLVLTLVGTGVRFGEATALTVGALDKATHSARIHTAWKQSGKVGAPKSRRSRRTIAVPPEVFAAIAPLVAGKGPGELVFLSPRGQRVRSGNFYNQAWKKAVDAAEPTIGKRPRVHDLRHTFASWAIQAGHSLPVVQRQLGHESITTTIDTYSHLARADFDALLTLGAGLTPVPQLEG